VQCLATEPSSQSIHIETQNIVPTLDLQCQSSPANNSETHDIEGPSSDSGICDTVKIECLKTADTPESDKPLPEAVSYSMSSEVVTFQPSAEAEISPEASAVETCQLSSEPVVCSMLSKEATSVPVTYALLSEAVASQLSSKAVTYSAASTTETLCVVSESLTCSVSPTVSAEAVTSPLSSKASTYAILLEEMTLPFPLETETAVSTEALTYLSPSSQQALKVTDLPMVVDPLKVEAVSEPFKKDSFEASVDLSEVSKTEATLCDISLCELQTVPCGTLTEPPVTAVEQHELRTVSPESITAYVIRSSEPTATCAVKSELPETQVPVVSVASSVACRIPAVTAVTEAEIAITAVEQDVSSEPTATCIVKLELPENEVPVHDVVPCIPCRMPFDVSEYLSVKSEMTDTGAGSSTTGQKDVSDTALRGSELLCESVSKPVTVNSELARSHSVIVAVKEYDSAGQGVAAVKCEPVQLDHVIPFLEHSEFAVIAVVSPSVTSVSSIMTAVHSTVMSISRSLSIPPSTMEMPSSSHTTSVSNSAMRESTCVNPVCSIVTTVPDVIALTSSILTSVSSVHNTASSLLSTAASVTCSLTSVIDTVTPSSACLTSVLHTVTSVTSQSNTMTPLTSTTTSVTCSLTSVIDTVTSSSACLTSVPHTVTSVTSQSNTMTPLTSTTTSVMSIDDSMSEDELHIVLRDDSFTVSESAADSVPTETSPVVHECQTSLRISLADDKDLSVCNHTNSSLQDSLNGAVLDSSVKKCPVKSRHDSPCKQSSSCGTDSLSADEVPSVADIIAKVSLFRPLSPIPSCQHCSLCDNSAATNVRILRTPTATKRKQSSQSDDSFVTPAKVRASLNLV